MDVTGCVSSIVTCGADGFMDSEDGLADEEIADGTILPNLCPDPVKEAYR
jgi:hypothetical protein